VYYTVDLLSVLTHQYLNNVKRDFIFRRFSRMRIAASQHRLLPQRHSVGDRHSHVRKFCITTGQNRLKSLTLLHVRVSILLADKGGTHTKTSQPWRRCVR
jgi:hypothetical protein